MGKTYLLKEFGRKKYETLHYFNFEAQANLSELFKPDLSPDRILSELSLYAKTQIRPQKDLIIFDEIQNSNEALNSLKYFQEEKMNFILQRQALY